MDYKVAIIILTVFFTVMQVIISTIYIFRKKYPFLLENAIIYFLYLSLLFICYKFKICVEWYLLIFVILTTLGHVFVGELLDAYKKIKIYDRFLHAFGSFSFSLFTYSIIVKTLNPLSLPTLYTSIFVINLGISLGALFEIIEFFVDVFFKTESQSGLKDTNVDLIADVIGSVIAGMTFGFFIR